MKTVAVIAPDFTPSSMPNALRVRLLVEHLEEYGWEPVVITTDPKHYEQPTDPENQALMRGNYEVIRTSAWPAKFTRRFGLGDIGLRSFWFQWRALSRLCRARKIDLVFISVPPNYPMMLGRLANWRFGIPYVIDYQDPYITEYYKTVPASQRPPKWRLAYAAAHLVEPFSVRRVAHITSVDTAYVAGVIERYPRLGPGDVTAVPLGVEPEDFNFIRQHPRPNPIFDPRDGFFHLSYAGRGGPDMLPAAGALFAALKHGRESRSIAVAQLFRRIRLHFVGTDYAHAGAERYQILPLAKEIGVEDQVEEHPRRVPYLTALQILLDSHALTVVGSTESYYTPSKIFPYILAGKPLIGIFHENSSVVGILRETGAGDAVTFGASRPPSACVPAVFEKLLALLTALDAAPGRQSGADERPTEDQSLSVAAVEWKAFEPYTAHAVTARLATAFEKALGKKL